MLLILLQAAPSSAAGAASSASDPAAAAGAPLSLSALLRFLHANLILAFFVLLALGSVGWIVGFRLFISKAVSRRISPRS